MKGDRESALTDSSLLSRTISQLHQQPLKLIVVIEVDDNLSFVMKLSLVVGGGGGVVVVEGLGEGVREAIPMFVKRKINPR